MTEVGWRRRRSALPAEAPSDAPSSLALPQTAPRSVSARGGSASATAAGTRTGPGVAIAVVSLRILAAALIVMVAQMALLGSVEHARAQHVAYTRLRNELALATAPVGQTDVTGRLLALGAPVAILRIPALHLDKVVLNGTTPAVLQDGPGHRRDTVLPGQAGWSVVYGRAAAYGADFGNLDRLQVGDSIVTVTGQGTSVFRVIDQRRAGDPVPAPLQSGQARLTLVTASGAAFMPSGVLRVDADLVGQPKPAPAPVLVASGLLASESPMAGDSSAWVAIVVLGELLLGAVLAVVWARARWGRWQAWLVGFPVLGALGLLTADHAARLLPNLM